MDIEALADKSAKVARLHRLRIPAAVRMVVLEEHKFLDRPHSDELVSNVCRELQKRATARRKKNKERNGYALDMFATAAARGGDPED
ncbi:MAG: hypothetical protein WBL19_01140 [Minisyncoccia bacterium]